MAFVKVDTRFRHDLARLGTKTTMVYLYLGLCVNGDQDSWPSQHRIATETGLTRGEVQSGLAKLQQLGFIIIHHHQEGPRHLSNSYTVNHHFRFGRAPNPHQLPLAMAISPEPCNHPDAPRIPDQSSQPLLDSPPDSACPESLAGRRTTEQEPDTTYQGAAPQADSPEKRREHMATADNKPVALYEVTRELFPKAGLAPPGCGHRCEGIGRLAAMERRYGWGRVLEEMEHARIDVAVGKCAQGDILSWIERRCQGGNSRGNQNAPSRKLRVTPKDWRDYAEPTRRMAVVG